MPRNNPDQPAVIHQENKSTSQQDGQLESNLYVKAHQEVTTAANVSVKHQNNNNNEPIGEGTSSLHNTGVLGVKLSSIGIFSEW